MAEQDQGSRWAVQASRRPPCCRKRPPDKALAGWVHVGSGLLNFAFPVGNLV